VHWRGRGPVPAGRGAGLAREAVASAGAGSFVVGAWLDPDVPARGAAFARFDAAAVLEDELHAAPESCVAVLQEGREVFARPCPRGPGAGALVAEVDVPVAALGWRLRLSPQRSPLHTAHGLAHLTLLAGLSISGLLFLAVRLARRAAARATEAEEAGRALRASELLYRTIVDTAQEGVWQVDAAGSTTFVNRRMADMLGRTTEGMVGRPVYDFMDAQMAVEVRRRFDARTPQSSFDMPLLRADGSEVWVMVSASPLFLPGGGVAGAVALVADITGRKQSEERLASYARQLEHSNRELQDFAVAASHDLQEPLRKITAFGSHLAETAGPRLDGEARDYLQRMQAAARRMAGLIESLLDLARVSTRARPFEPTPLGDVVQGVLADLELRVRDTGARVAVGRLPTVRVDAVQMRQLFQNLVANALKFRRPGRPPAVSIRSLDGAGEGLRIEVADEGIGFDEAHLDLIFRPFQRLHSRAEFEGNGMGLAICRKIALRHGGSLDARSVPGRGSVFTLSLPAALKEEPEACPIVEPALAGEVRS
ncbi:MAG TPA: ATP-binding protein, partial [Vicinamibacteria bacterium]|nr:ATP-binding protein [Vicinamibacteria bacterium]